VTREPPDGSHAQPINLAETTVIKAANAFCMSLPDGRLPLTGDHPIGLYADDTRYLRGYELRLQGWSPRLLISSDDAGSAAVFELTTQGLAPLTAPPEPIHSLRVRIARRLLPNSMTDRVTLHSYAREAFEFELEMAFDVDFRSMLEIRGLVEPQMREIHRTAEGDTLRFATVGLDGRERSTEISWRGAVAEEDGRMRALVRLDSGRESALEMHIGLSEQDGSGHSGAPIGARADHHPAVNVNDHLAGRILRRSLLDARLLESRIDGNSYCAAGVPWYATLFGRDSIIAALELLPFDARLAEQTLRLLAGRLGTGMDDEHDEEPGKVIHELRGGELGAADLTPLARYYGTVDATPLFLCLLCEHADWTGSLDLFRELRSPVDQALRWIDEFGDLDGDSLLEYLCRSSRGLVNQGWKDSWDGVLDERGDPLRAPIALVEVQGYVIAAKRGLARIFELDGDPARAQTLREDAARVGGALERFWLPDQGFYSMALDADKTPSAALASNQGHLLWAGALSRPRAAAVCRSLMSERSYSGWGVRTLADQEAGFNPIGYHVGTVWPHDNALFAMGLRKYAFDREFLTVFEGLLDAAASFSGYRLPELFAGLRRSAYEDPVPYPVACRPQAWAAGALPAMLIAGLGLVPDALERRLSIARPSLPRHLSRVELNGFHVGDARVDLLFERVAGRPDSVALTDAHVDGDIDVVLRIESRRVDESEPTVDGAAQPGGALAPGAAGA
jgi:glycogen debranching enzyme